MKILLFVTFVSFCEIISSAFAQSEGTITNPSAAPGVEFRPYNRPHLVRVVPSAVDSRFALPVYYRYLPRVYHIIGSVVVHGAGREIPFDETEIIRSAVAAAKLHGADAFCLKPMTAAEKSVMRGDGPEVIAWGYAIKWGPRPPKNPNRF